MSNGGEYTGSATRLPAGQTHPGGIVPDHRDAAGVPTVAANTRVAAITGIVLGVIPALSLIGLIVSIVSLAGYRKAGARPTLAVIGVVVSAVVLIGFSLYLLMPGGLLAASQGS